MSNFNQIQQQGPQQNQNMDSNISFVQTHSMSESSQNGLITDIEQQNAINSILPSEIIDLSTPPSSPTRAMVQYPIGPNCSSGLASQNVTEHSIAHALQNNHAYKVNT